MSRAAGDGSWEHAALVTGASSGIGAAFARALRARGEKLVLVARRAQRLSEMAAALGGPQAVLVVPLDLTQADAPARLQDALFAKNVTVGTLVNNAGIGQVGPFAEADPERLLQIVDLDVRAVVALTRRLLPPMVERRRGGIINVVSTSAFQPVPFMAVYSAAKAFVLSFTEALSDELAGTGVRVQALCPGLTESEFHEPAGTDRVLFRRTPMMSAEAVAACSLRALDRGVLRVVPGWHNRAVSAVQGFFPRRLVRGVAGTLFRPRPGPR